MRPLCLAMFLGACGGSSPPAVEPVPAPVAPLDRLEAAAAEDPVEPPSPTAPARSPAPAPEAEEGLGLGAGVGTGAAAPQLRVRWWASVRSPGVPIRRVPLDDRRLDERVGGWRCTTGGLSRAMHLQLQQGAISRQQSEARELLCTDGSTRRTETARCGYDDAGQGPVPTSEPARLLLGPHAAQHEVLLECEVLP